ncbi:hypothetical protein PTSG_02270 [Salpingoeca rosetta]|uniref:Sulfotransferase domain-containing protein n=1 Tax=Salpingoeca rosetta (strain ATCC 50818 / BSB-021) TaxID=946362 RepID=F2U1Q2_SALR5|nr:uncharacterized protein PTSG_02270 [Salpingoeca rosetta]EGD81554.1 hypothetical protein PTSG_02270 [Salpingoeca rosetta]|eukprot:XP_004996758.1 hypothetical protein PTSG_02270 [Salpingoeca rosetta]
MRVRTTLVALVTMACLVVAGFLLTVSRYQRAPTDAWLLTTTSDVGSHANLHSGLRHGKEEGREAGAGGSAATTTTVMHATTSTPVPLPQDAGDQPNSPAPHNGNVKRICGPGNTPLTHIKYIKTHKTGSSTLTNILHRFGVKHDLKMALPKDNVFYAWPQGDERSIPASVESIKGSAPPYDMLCSAHVRYVKPALESVVPGGTYVTVLRRPTSHFMSSWSHWHVWEHIMHRGGPELTPDQFLQGFEQYQGYLGFGDRILLLNSYAYDLGISHPTPGNIQQLITEMEENFGVVLITEHMLESLVLLKRTLCWSLEDVLHLGLKVSKQKAAGATDAIAEHRRELIHELDWADTLLYDHFNRSLWRRIEQEDGFMQEVEELKRQVQVWSERCAPLQHYDEDAHRVFLEERPKISDEQRLCHYMWLDSKGFVKHLKKREGYPIEKLECWATHANTKIMYLVTDHPADDAAMNVIAQVVGGSRGRVATADYSQGPDTSHLPDGSLLPPPNHIFRSPASTAFMITGFTHTRPFMDRMHQGLMFIATFRDPVSEFLDTWTRLDMPGRMRNIDPQIPSPLDSFLDDPDHWLQLLRNEDGFDYGHHLFNRNAYRMGVSRSPNKHEIDEAKKHVLWFALIMIAEKPDESMVMLRRTVCWTIKDVINFDMDQWKASTAFNVKDHTTRDELMITKRIYQLNWIDKTLYDLASNVFRDKVARQVSFKEELQLYHEQRTAHLAACEAHKDESMAAKLVETILHPSRCHVMSRTRDETFADVSSSASEPFSPPPHP